MSTIEGNRAATARPAALAPLRGAGDLPLEQPDGGIVVVRKEGNQHGGAVMKKPAMPSRRDNDSEPARIKWKISIRYRRLKCDGDSPIQGAAER